MASHTELASIPQNSVIQGLNRCTQALSSTQALSQKLKTSHRLSVTCVWWRASSRKSDVSLHYVLISTYVTHTKCSYSFKSISKASTQMMCSSLWKTTYRSISQLMKFSSSFIRLIRTLTATGAMKSYRRLLCPGKKSMQLWSPREVVSTEVKKTLKTFLSLWLVKLLRSSWDSSANVKFLLRWLDNVSQTNLALSLRRRSTLWTESRRGTRHWTTWGNLSKVRICTL